MTRQAASHSKTSNATIYGGAAFLFTWTVVLLLLCFTRLASYLPPSIGMSIERLGQFGDAFAPVTAFFALLAAVGAWRSYEAQREQLNDERGRNHTQRFDELFFRLVDYYESTMNSVASRSVVPSGAWESMSLRETVKSVREAMVEMVEFDSILAKEQPDQFSRWFGLLHGADSSFTVLNPLAEQIPAMLRWLEQSRVTNVLPYGDLLCARLSDVEIWFWQRAIAVSAPDLIDFAQEMRIFGEGGYPPKYIGTGRGMTTADAENFVLGKKVPTD